MTKSRRTSRHGFHGVLKAVREVSQPDKHRVASSPNPWPKCQSCFHRVPELCPITSVCVSCCLPLGHPHDDEDS